MNYWYEAQTLELFLDLDSRRALRRAVTVLSVAMRTRKLSVDSVYLYPTKKDGHFHLIVTLKKRISFSARLAWCLWMGNDRLRTAYILMRSIDDRMPSSATAGDLLVTSKVYYRSPDAVCRCRRKHKADAVTSKCPAMRALLGGARAADYFARTGPTLPGRRMRVPWGQVSKQQICQWADRRKVKGDAKGILQRNQNGRRVPRVGQTATRGRARA